MIKKIANKLTAYLVAQAIAFMSMPVYAVNNDSKPIDQQNIQIVEEEQQKHEVYSQIVYPTESAKLEYMGVVLDIPKGAVDAAITITIEKLNNIEMVPGTMKNSTSGAIGYRFGPHGTQFQKNILVSLPFDSKIAESETALSNLFTYFYNDITDQWERLERVSIDKDNFLVTSRTNHFTDMINTTLQLPELPQGINFDLNSIKDLKAADPTEGVPRIKGLSANNNGTASFQIPLRIPQGRGGATPSFAISYNSESQNGWLGRGFDINISQISIDTRFGLPSYTIEDTYMLDGQQMVLSTQNSGEDHYLLRREGSFNRIIHHSSGNQNYWEVTSKDGSIREYGQNEAWIGPDRNNKTKVYKWHLSRSIDSNGNTVEYNYGYDSENQYSYLRSIVYSGHTSGETGHYKIDFIADPNERPDRRIDARGHFASKLAERLGRIEISHDETPIRAYQLNYRENEFGQSQIQSYSEEDSEGNIFYTYKFQYYELPVHIDDDGNSDGYNAFGEEIKQWDTSYAPGFDVLSATNNFGIDGSLYTGLSAKIPNPFGEDQIIASAGLKAGVGLGWSYSDMGLMDLNGDGLCDIYQRDGQNLNWYPNSGLFGKNFSTNRTMSMPGFNSLLNYEDSRKLFLGATASGAGATADYNHQWVWTDSLVTFSDVDADGLVDIVWRDKDFWLRNVAGSSFSKEYWDFDNTQSVSNIQNSGISDEFNKGYYQQSPLRRWTSRWPGTITIKNNAHLVTPSNSHDGLILETWYGASEPQRMEFFKNDSNTLEQEFNINAQANQPIYFYLDPKEDERGDRVSWESQLKYENINYFYDMKNTADYSPPEDNNSTLPHNDQRFANLYNRSYESSSYVYKLKPDWEKYANVPVYEAMVEYGYFIPKALSEKIFNEMFTGLGDTSQESFTSEQKSLSSAWDYNKLTQNYNRINNQADWVIKKYICQYTSYEERRELAFYKLYDGRLVPLKNKSLVMNNSRFYSNSISKIITEEPPENPGIYNLSKGYLLDRLYLEDGTEAARLWLQENQNVFVEEITAIPENFKMLDVNASSVRINLHNVEITYSLSNFDPVIEEMPADFYENTVHDIVIGNNKFGFFDFYTLTSDIYKQLETIATIDQAELLKANYIFNETDKLWQLKNEITNTNIMVIIGLLQSLYPISTGPFYDTEPNLKNIICLDDEQYNKLIYFFKAEEQNIVKNAFNKITVDNINYYLPIQNHQDISQQLSIYYRENIAFPWYEQKDGLRVLKKLEQQEEIQNRKEVLTAFWNILNLGTWKNVIKKVNITSDVKLNVENSILPANQSLLEMAIGVENIQLNSEVGKITFPGLNSQGQTTVYQRFIPQFNSTQDFNAMYSQLSKIRKKILAAKSNSTTNYIDDFSGGYMGWEYNTWKSYKDFDPELVGKNKITGKIDDIESKYTLGIQSNQQKKDNDKVITTIINKTGKEYVTELDTNTWIGEISSYNVPTLQSDGTNLNIEYTFAPYIKADEMAPCRKGGDFIHETFQGSSATSKNTLTLLNKSLSNSNEVTLGYNGLFGVNVSINSSTSMQYSSLEDFNGDRYPDMLNTPTDHRESKTFMAGSKKGLTNNQTITVPFENLNRYSNLTAGFGITGSTGSMAIAVKTDADGKEIASNIVQGLGNSWSLSTSGTMSQGIQTNSLMDINGDGLPDYLSRNNLEDISVKINTGIGNTWSNASWTNVMNEELADWRYDLTHGYIFSSHSSGLSYSNNGSIGGRINYTLPGFDLVTYTLTAGAGIGITANNNKTSYRLVDVNSDGLPDQVAKAADSKYFMVKFNLGDTFSDKIVKLYRPDWGVKDATLLNYIAESIPKLLGNFTGATVNGNSQQNNETPVLQNNTNDGPFSQAVRPLEIEDTLDYSTGISLSLGGNARFQWDLGFSGLELTPGLNGSGGRTTAALQFRDIDGDGFPDHVLKMPREDYLRVKTNNMGKTGLLKGIKLPFGGDIALEYGREGNTTNMPQSRYVLNKVTNTDPIQGPDESIHSYVTRYEYQNGYYHREERQFFGFETVKTIAADGTSITMRYENRNYYKQGQLINQKQYGSNENLISETQNFYEIIPSNTFTNRQSICYALSRTDTTIFDPEGKNDIQTRTDYKYNETGSIREIIEYGSIYTYEDDYTLNIDYKSDLGGYRISYPEEMIVTDSNGRLLRKRSCEDYDSHGNPETIRYYRTDYDYLEYHYQYNQYGYPETSTAPNNVTTKYTYDKQQHQFIEQIDVYPDGSPLKAYTSKMTWNYAMQTNITRSDQNKNLETRKYDNYGRLTDLFSPYDELDGIPAVHFEYHQNENTDFWYTQTENKISFNSDDEQTMATLTYIDGLGRVRLTAKQGEIGYTAIGRQTGWNVSGAMTFDNKGRVTKQGQPVFSAGEELPAFPELKNPVTTIYDDQDRAIEQIFPYKSKENINENVRIKTDFSFEDHKALITTIDQKGNITETLKYANGAIKEIRKKDQKENLLTSTHYNYDALGQLTEALDHETNPVKSTYDLLGNKTSIYSKETGLTEYRFDNKGQLYRKIDANLRDSGDAIDYKYDNYGRLRLIDYPWMEDTTFNYGEPNAPDNTAGRLVSQSYEAGLTSYKYGQLGEITSMTKTIKRLGPMGGSKTDTIHYQSDYLGRMEKIIYPDEETISYKYDYGGQIKSIIGITEPQKGLTTNYVQEIGYDEFGQRTYIKLGNNVETFYSYDPERRLLDTIKTTDNEGKILQNIDYDFDDRGNVDAYTNDSKEYYTSQTYTYDALNQLSTAEGTHLSRPNGVISYKSQYTQSFGYDTLGRLTGKASQVLNTNGSSQGKGLNYILDYQYYADKPHQPERIGNMYYKYDLNGNMIEEREGGHSEGQTIEEMEVTEENGVYSVPYAFGLYRDYETNEDGIYERTYTWDEENRLKQTLEDDLKVQYTYDPSGQRTVKYSSQSETLYFDSLWSLTRDTNDFRQSKHIYLGQTRIATKLGLEQHEETHYSGYEKVNTFYYSSDHLGSAQYITDFEGSRFSHYEYTPHGELWIEKSKDEFDMIPFRFTGKELDEETNLYYMSARYFSPKTGVWISADPAGGELINPNRQGFSVVEATNWFSYCRNNPVRYNDPSGLLSNDPQPLPIEQDITGTGPSADNSNYITVSPASTNNSDSANSDTGGAAPDVSSNLSASGSIYSVESNYSDNQFFVTGSANAGYVEGMVRYQLNLVDDNTKGKNFLGLKGKAAALNVQGVVGVGEENLNIAVKGVGDIAVAKAEMGIQHKDGFMFVIGAKASAVSGRGTIQFNIFGIEIETGVEGHALTGGFNLRAGYTKSRGFHYEIGVSALFGASLILRVKP